VKILSLQQKWLDTYCEETLGILKNVDTTVAEVWLLRTLDTVPSHVVLVELSLSITAALAYIPLFLEIPEEAPQLVMSMYRTFQCFWRMHISDDISTTWYFPTWSTKTIYGAV